MIEVHHLDNSRSQRILWLLEELELPYEIISYKRDPVTRLALDAGASRGPLKDYPNLVRLHERLKSRPAYQRALDRGGPYGLGR